MTQSNTIRHSKFNSIAIAAVFALVVCLAVPAAQAAPVIPWVGGDGNFSDVYNGGQARPPRVGIGQANRTLVYLAMSLPAPR